MARLMIAGVSSGCGKTSVICGLLQALKDRGHDLKAYKCGPDYIDGIIHERALGVPAGNLDSFFCNRDEICTLLDRKGLSMIEGVMGYYDGISMTSKASSHEIAALTDTPAVLVVDCKGMSSSICAVLHGFCSYREDSRIKGVIFNRLSPMLYNGVKELCEAMGIRSYGFLPDMREAVFESRRLGLVTDEAIDSCRRKIRLIAQNMEKYIDLNGLLQLSESADPLNYNKVTIDKISDSTIAVARDEAFCFNYSDNISLFKAMGCHIEYFSPLRDRGLPPCDRLIIGGGYPELYAEELSQNKSMLRDIKSKIDGGLKTVAECGGFMYLNESIDGRPMAEAVKGRAINMNKLQSFGYITMTALKDNILCSKGGSIKAHEFHYYDSSAARNAFRAVKPVSGREWYTGHVTESMYCGFPHIYFWGNRAAAESFVR